MQLKINLYAYWIKIEKKNRKYVLKKKVVQNELAKNKGSTVHITEEKQIFDVCKTETVKI